MIGIVVAMPSEAHALFGSKGWSAATYSNNKFKFKYIRSDYLVIQSGLGLNRADIASRWLLDQGVSALMNMGVSGGLNAELVAGDLVLAQKLQYEKNKAFESDSDWVARCYEHLISQGMLPYQGAFFSVSKAALTIEAKHKLATETCALAVDMESAAVARVAASAGKSFLSLRVICDVASKKVVLDPALILTQEGQIRPFQLAVEIIRKPGLLIDLPSLGKDFNVALAGLKRSWNALEKINAAFHEKTPAS